MSEATYETLESEAYEGEAYGDAYEGEGEAYEGEAFEGETYGEDARSRAYRQARQRQIMRARQREILQRGTARPVRPPAAGPARSGPARPGPATINAIRAVDLDAKVAEDSMRRAIAQADRRASRSMYSALATGAVGQALDTYQENLKDHPFVRAAIRWAPLAILPADKSRKGFEGIVLHPAFVSGALIGGIFLVGRLTVTSRAVVDIRVAIPRQMNVGDKTNLAATPVDRDGRTVSDAKVEWQSSDPNKLKIDSAAGTLEAIAAGSVVVSATTGDVTVPTMVEVSTATSPGVVNMRIAIPSQMKIGEKGNLAATPVDRDGRTVSGAKVEWQSSDLNKLKIDSTAGTVEAIAAGSVVVTVTAGDVTVPTVVMVS